ncbi:cytochrome P450 [Xylariaceae sp. FL0255]|nr:cytochrome P450 [Xylariaceae sp. FL0255]
MVNTIAAHKAIQYTHAYDTIKPPLFASLAGEITGVGLLFSEGDDHRRQRRLLAGPFSLPSLKKILPVFQSEAGVLSNQFESILLQRFRELYDRLFNQGRLGQLISAINAFIPIRRFVPLKANRRYVNANRDLRIMTRQIIEERDAALKNGSFKKKAGDIRDLLTYMLEEVHAQQQETGVTIWTTDDIVGHLLNFTAAGHETSATALAWSLYALSTRHEIQSRLRTEIQEFLSRTTSPTPSYEEINGLHYLNNFVREILRLYSPEGVYIPKGTQIDLHMPIMHLSTQVWGPDAEVFNPDRWDKLTGDAANPYAFQAFAQGPRMCPGRNMAIIQIKATLIELLSKWQFLGIERWEGKRAADGEQGEGELLVGGEEAIGRSVKLANPALTYHPAGGLMVRFERL